MGDLLKMSPTQMIITGVFLAFIVIGFLVLALGEIGGGSSKGSVLVWGTISKNNFEQVQSASGLSGKGSNIVVTYVEKDMVTYEKDLIEALASGSGPDIFFLPHEWILKHKNKVTPIVYDAYPLRDFTDTFVKEGQLFAFSDGIYAVPFIIDPMVMYWNTTLFSNAGIPRPPEYWDEFFDITSRLTIKDRSLNISQSAFALGESRNINYTEEIVSAMLLQNGIQISTPDTKNRYESSLGVKGGETEGLPAVSVLNFYTQFSNPTNDFYTWNRSLPEAQNMFIQTDLAMYLGFASELNTLRQKNPNLTFDVAKFPQARLTNERITYGRMTGLAIAKASRNKQLAYEVILKLTSRDGIVAVVEKTNNAPVRVDVFSATSDSLHMPIFQEMALWSRAWLEPDPAVTKRIFDKLINDITSGRTSAGEAISRFGVELKQAYVEIGF